MRVVRARVTQHREHAFIKYGRRRKNPNSGWVGRIAGTGAKRYACDLLAPPLVQKFVCTEINALLTDQLAADADAPGQDDDGDDLDEDDEDGSEEESKGDAEVRECDERAMSLFISFFCKTEPPT